MSFLLCCACQSFSRNKERKPGPDPIQIVSASTYTMLRFKHSDWVLEVTRPFSTNQNAKIPVWSKLSFALTVRKPLASALFHANKNVLVNAFAGKKWACKQRIKSLMLIISPTPPLKRIPGNKTVS